MIAVFVAHPDDESLWCGGFLAANPGTHVYACSVAERDTERQVQFFAACEILGAEGRIIGGKAGFGLIDTKLAEWVAERYDTIVTHNHLGEYGHAAHIGLHHALKRVGKPMLVFNYGLARGSPIDWERKERAILCYKNERLLEPYSKRFDLTSEVLIAQRPT